MGTNRYYLRQAGRITGPFAWDDLAPRIASGELGPGAGVAPEAIVMGVPAPGDFVTVASLQADPAVCVRCGAQGATPRRLSSVMSFVYITRTNESQPSLCDPCAGLKASRALITTGLLGWWGFPWGLIRTPIALGRNASTLLKARAIPTAVSLALIAVVFALPVLATLAILQFSEKKTHADQEAGREELSERATRAVDAGRKAAERGDAEEALRQARIAETAEPRSWLVQSELAHALTALGRFTEAAVAARLAAERNPLHREVRQELLSTLVLADDDDALRFEALSALERWPDLPEAHAAQAYGSARQGRLPEAVASLRRVPEASTAGLLAVRELVFRQVEAYQHDQALAVLDEVRTTWAPRGPVEEILRSARSGVLCAAGQFREAQEAVAASAETSPILKQRQALVALEAGDDAGAEEHFRELIAAQGPSSSFTADALLWQGIALVRLGRVEAARAAWASAPKPRKGERPAFEHDALAYLSSGERGEALKAHVALPRHASDKNDLLLVEALRLELQGDLPGARAAYQRCLDASPGSGFPAHLARRSLAALAPR